MHIITEEDKDQFYPPRITITKNRYGKFIKVLAKHRAEPGPDGTRVIILKNLGEVQCA